MVGKTSAFFFVVATVALRSSCPVIQLLAKRNRLFIRTFRPPSFHTYRTFCAVSFRFPVHEVHRLELLELLCSAWEKRMNWALSYVLAINKWLSAPIECLENWEKRRERESFFPSSLRWDKEAEWMDMQDILWRKKRSEGLKGKWCTNSPGLEKRDSVNRRWWRKVDACVAASAFFFLLLFCSVKLTERSGEKNISEGREKRSQSHPSLIRCQKSCISMSE